MAPSYFRIRLPFARAYDRLKAWTGDEWTEPRETDGVSGVGLAWDHGFPGPALCAHQSAEWTVFEDLTRTFFSIPAESWLEFAATDSFFLAGYNEATFCAELIVIEAGRVLREFLRVDSVETDVGMLPSEKTRPIRDWIEVASIIDNDELYGLHPDRSWLLMTTRAGG